MDGIRISCDTPDHPCKNQVIAKDDMGNIFKIPVMKPMYLSYRLVFSLCFLGMLRISELINLNFEDVSLNTSEGIPILDMNHTRSKKNRYGEGHNVNNYKCNESFDTIEVLH